LNIWLRLYSHALLLGSQTFPGIELFDESPGCSPNGFVDIWKGDYHGKSVSVKVIRTQDQTPLIKIKKVYSLFVISNTHSSHFLPDIPPCE